MQMQIQELGSHAHTVKSKQLLLFSTSHRVEDQTEDSGSFKHPNWQRSHAPKN